MALAYVVVAIITSAYAGRTMVRPYVDGDLFWQRRLGDYVLLHHALPGALGNETFTAAGAAWTPQEWLLGIAVSIAVSHGALWVLGILAALAFGCALTITIARSRLFGASPLAVIFTTISLGFDVSGSFGIRAQVFAWPFFTALLLVLDLSGNAIFLALPLVAVWANLHASAMIAIPMIWIDAIASSIRRPRDPETKRRAILALLVPFAVLATPLGIRLPLYALTLVSSPIRRFIDEWQPLGLHHYFFWAGGLPMLIVTVLAIRTLWRERPRDLAWALLFLVMAIGAVRNASLFGFVVAPLAARALDVLLGRFPIWSYDPVRSPGPRNLAVAAGAALSAIIFFSTVRAGAADAWRPPRDALSKISALPGEHRLYCYDFALCSPALDYPNIRVFMDGRADPYPPAVWYAFNRLRRTSKGWQEVISGYGINAILAKPNDALDKALKKQPAWQRVTISDRCCHLYLRRTLPAP